MRQITHTLNILDYILTPIQATRSVNKMYYKMLHYITLTLCITLQNVNKMKLFLHLIPMKGRNILYLNDVLFYNVMLPEILI